MFLGGALTFHNVNAMDNIELVRIPVNDTVLLCLLSFAVLDLVPAFLGTRCPIPTSREIIIYFLPYLHNQSNTEVLDEHLPGSGAPQMKCLGS